MPESESPRSKPLIESPGEKSDSNPDAVSPAANSGRRVKGENDPSLDRPRDVEGKHSRLERLSYLSSEMTGLISELYQEVETAVYEQHRIEEDLNQKRNELKALHDIEASAAELEQIVEAHKKRKSELEQILESRRNAIETEKSKWQQEEAEYLENRKIRRQREEQEHRQQWAAEQEKAKRTVEDDLRKLQQKSREELEMLKRRLLEREERIRRKESELNLLIQELGQFMSNLAGRTQSQQSKPSSPAVPGLALPYETSERAADWSENEDLDYQMGW